MLVVWQAQGNEEPATRDVTLHIFCMSELTLVNWILNHIIGYYIKIIYDCQKIKIFFHFN